MHNRCKDYFGYCGGKQRANCNPKSCDSYITATEEIKPLPARKKRKQK